MIVAASCGKGTWMEVVYECELNERGSSTHIFLSMFCCRVIPRVDDFSYTPFCRSCVLLLQRDCTRLMCAFVFVWMHSSKGSSDILVDWKRAFLTRHENASSMVNIWKISQFVVFVFSHMNDRYGMVLVLVRLSGVSARVLLLSLIGGVQLHLQTTGRSRGSIWLKLILNKIFAYECHF